MASLARNSGVKVAIIIFLVIDNVHVLAWILFSLLPTTKGQEGEGLLQCNFDQREVRVLE
jgi:hypothetical protein